MLVPYAFTAIAAAAAAVPHGHAAHQQTLQPHKVNKKAPASVHMPTLPPIYYINLAANTDRREYMERKLASVPTSSVTRVEAVDTDDVERNLADGKLQLADGLTVLPSNNTDPGEHIAGAYKLSEYACTGSHLRAIKTAYDAGDQLALIIEDDVSFDLVRATPGVRTGPQLSSSLTRV